MKVTVVCMLRRWLVVALLIILSVIITGCGNEGNKQQQVNIAYFPNLTHAQALVGKAEGSFEKAYGPNIKVKWLEFNAGFSEIEALLADEVDIGYIGPGPAIGGYIKSKGRLQIIAGAVNGGAILVARKDAPVNSPRDLAGKRIAIPQFGNTQDLALRELLRQNGLKSTADGGNVDILQAENSDIKTYLARGYIDAALLPEPWGTRLIKEVDAKMVLDYKEILRGGKYPTSVVIVRKEFMDKHPDLVQKFLDTHLQLTEEIQQNPQRAMNLVNSEIKKSQGKNLSDDVLREASKRLVVTYNPESAGIQEFVKILVRSGYLHNRPDTADLINLKPINGVIKAKGMVPITP